MTTTAPERLLVSINEAAQMIGICPASFYKLMAAGRISTKKIGRRTLVPVAYLKAWVQDLPDGEPTPAS